MKKDEYNVIGLMSGTSCDGLDVCLCHFFRDNSGKWTFEVRQAETFAYDSPLKNKLKECTTLKSEELFLLDVQLGKLFAQHCQKIISTNKVDFISSHGHTVFHQPANHISVQIGNLTALQVETGIPVIGDFRMADVLKSGQGAPLVPVGDSFLFPDYDACINLGGICNISATTANDTLVAYDIGVCNLLLNYLAGEKGLEYDTDGHIAAKGKCLNSLLDQLLSSFYHKSDPPKSLGIENIKADIFPRFDKINACTEDKMNTAVQYIAQIISDEIHANSSIRSVLLSGGGAFNSYLINCIKTRLINDISIEIESPIITNYKEAIIFAFLGVLRSRNEINVLKSVTGASTDSCSGTMIGF